MSAFPASPQPTPAAPQVVPAPERPRGKWPVYLFAIVLLVAGAWLFRPRADKPAADAAAAIRTIKAVRGNIESTRRIAGSITAARFANITVPILQAPESGRGLTLMRLADS